LISALSSILSNIYLWLLVAVTVFVCLATTGHRRTRIAGLGMVAVLWVIGTRPGAEAIIRPLEGRYSPPSIDTLKSQGVRQVVVLTGGGYPVTGEELASAFPHASAYRFLGGMELCSRLGPDCRIIFSGSAGRQLRERATADTMRDLAQVLEPARDAVAESRSGSTEEHPGNVRPLIGDSPFALVTSAMHMPRTVRTFRRAGLEPIPYPVDFLATGHYGWSDLLPSAENLWEVGAALREYEALVLYSIRGT
jgi:uncharacterized SAM-binding protein YcdF (DUF218 family)